MKQPTKYGDLVAVLGDSRMFMVVAHHPPYYIVQPVPEGEQIKKKSVELRKLTHRDILLRYANMLPAVKQAYQAHNLVIWQRRNLKYQLYEYHKRARHAIARQKKV